MKKTILIILSLLSVIVAEAQQRDRLADLNVGCYTNLCVSATGKLWMSTSCGMVYTADDIHSTWRTVMGNARNFGIHGGHFEYMAAWGGQTAVAAGFIQGRPSQDFVFRTTDGGEHWDTVVIDPNLKWVHACSFFSDGRVWFGSASGRSDGVLAYSADSGLTFHVLRTDFDGETGIHTLHMVTADSGYVGNYTNSIFSTSDNWRTIHRVITPMEQLHWAKHADDNLWIEKIRQWKNELIVKQIVRGRLSETFHTPLNGNIQWQPSPITLYDYEVDSVTGALWAVSDSEQLVRLTDWEHIQHYGIQVGRIVGVVDGKVYCEGNNAVLRVSPDGKTDTCGFYTTEYPIEQDEWYWDTLSHGSRLWACDRKSVYLKDSIGWYRVAQMQGVGSIRLHPESADNVIVFYDGHHYSVDTAGHVKPYSYRQPLGDFVKGGLWKVEIITSARGCFHGFEDTVCYNWHDGFLYESCNTVEKGNSPYRTLPVSELENALLKLGERYNIFPTPQDFGLQDTTVNIHAVYDENIQFWSTSQLGYKLSFVNAAGDTLRMYNSVSEGNNFDGSTRFPWLLPMHVTSDKVHFVTYQPCLWQVLKELMPDSMMLRDQLDNITLHPLNELKNGDLLFLKGGNDKMAEAIRESTGDYTHVAIVERDSTDCLWIIEASSAYGVRRIPKNNWRWGFYDVYRLNVPFDAAAVVSRAKSFVGQHYDNAYLPDNGELYCSELVYEVYLDSNGKHLFESKPMNFRDHRGRMPKYWKKHFEKLGMPVPEGVSGTNPTDLSRSPLLKRIR